MTRLCEIPQAVSARAETIAVCNAHHHHAHIHAHIYGRETSTTGTRGAG